MLRKVCRQKDSCSFFQVIKFSWAWITLYPCRQRSNVRFSALFLGKHEDVFTKPNTIFINILVSSNLFGLPFKHAYCSLNRTRVIVWGGESALLTVLQVIWTHCCWFYCWKVGTTSVYFISYRSYFNTHLISMLTPTPQILRGSLSYLKSIIDQNHPLAWLFLIGGENVT